MLREISVIVDAEPDDLDTNEKPEATETDTDVANVDEMKNESNTGEKRQFHVY